MQMCIRDRVLLRLNFFARILPRLASCPSVPSLLLEIFGMLPGIHFY